MRGGNQVNFRMMMKITNGKLNCFKDFFNLICRFVDVYSVPEVLYS